jgi:hypothetical protein
VVVLKKSFNNFFFVFRWCCVWIHAKSIKVVVNI